MKILSLIIVTLILTSLQAKESQDTNSLKKFCNTVEEHFKKYNWGQSNCEQFDFKSQESSNWGTPLVWLVKGEIEPNSGPVDTTLLLCGVHGDEITPIKFCFDVLNHLKQNIKGKRIVIAPIVSPDGFFTAKPTRTNGRGVDPNRNFPTKNWDTHAIEKWKTRYKSARRRFPGFQAASEPEVLFQMRLINEYQPSKIISVHSPLTLIDYDGPALSKQSKTDPAKHLLLNMSKKANGYRIKDYPTFPGSLGRYAGNEKQIPTYTLELPSSDPAKHHLYWDQFKGAINQAFIQELPRTQPKSSVTKKELNP